MGDFTEYNHCHLKKRHLQPGNLRVAEGVILHQLYHVVIQKTEKEKKKITSRNNPELRILYIKSHTEIICIIIIIIIIKVKYPARDRSGPWGSGRLKLRIFLTFDIMKVVRSSPLRTGRLYPQEFPGTHF